MGLNSPQEPQVDTIPSKEILTQTQKNVLDRILLILESDPKLRENLNIAFEKNLQSII
jgi:hypothetical protein